MKLICKQFDQTLPAPAYKTSGAAALDLYVRVPTTIPAKSVGYAPLNVALQLPANCWALLSARSSLHKRGLMLANGIGVGDFDFRGPQDEYVAALYNFTDEDVVVERGERVVQLIVLQREPVVLELVADFNTKDTQADNRGGFGSTGRKL